ncbi:MAG: Ig-like domain-containing protein [Clostridia bacterium]|nr:Ig-like domain-containing protein [Clostridia bacterium]
MFEGLKEINNPENFKTGTATTFYNTFYGCFSLEEVDFSSWDVSNVTTIKYMFYRCYGLKYANLSGWNTSNITNMHGVFEMTPPNATVTPDYSLKKVDLTGWDTSNVTTMENMFKNCEALTELDLSSFDTSKVTTMRFMFYYCKSLKNIYVGEGWTTESIKNINDGIFNCCYALVGGTDDQEENIRIYNDKHPSAYYPPSVEYAKTKEENGYLTDVSHKPEPEKKEFKVTYEFTGNIPEGVTAPAESIYEEGATADTINVAPVDGYTFSGWITEDTTVTDNSFTVNNDIHFVGSWTKLYKVEYRYADGYPIPEGAPELPQPKYYAADEWVDVFGVPYVDRHVFIGWTTDDADITGDMFMMPENDVVLYGYYKIPVESIEIMADENITINEENQIKINVYVNPEDATIKDIIYESSDESIITVDKYGNITAVGEGTAEITVYSKDDPTKNDTVTVTVKVPVTDITVDRNEITLREDGTEKITVTVTPDSATDKKITYESSDETVVKVDENGNITAVGAGEATVTVSSADNPSVKEEIKVTVKNPVTEITVPSGSINVYVDDITDIKAKVNEDATNKELIYESNNPGVAKVDKDGNVTAVSEGEAIITVTSKDDPSKTETVKITVKPKKVPVSSVKVDKPEFDLIKGEKDKINVTIVPDSATNKDVTFKSLNPDVVTVDQNGNITAVGKGTASILVISKDDPTKAATVMVTVKVPVEDIAVNKEVFELTEGEKDKITVTVTPDDATDKSITYKSSDETVVKVDENGNIEAVGEGEAIITVTSKDDPSKTVTVTVKIEKAPEPEKPEYIIEVPELITLFKGEKKPIGIVITPDDGVIVPIYKSSDESVVKIDAEGNIIGIGVGAAVITADFGGGDIRLIPVTVLTVPIKQHVCFGKTDGIGWYEVSVNGGDFFPQGPNSTLEVAEGSVLVVRVQDMWIDDEFDFYVNGKKVPLDPANTITVIVDGYMLIGALSMDVPVPDAEESVSILQKILNGIKDFFSMIKSFFENLFS